MTRKQPKKTPASEAEVAAPSIAGLTLDNLEDRVEALRHASGPTRSARAKINRASREAMTARRKENSATAKKPIK